jgi:hypothetical protein
MPTNQKSTAHIFINVHEWENHILVREDLLKNTELNNAILGESPRAPQKSAPKSKFREFIKKRLSNSSPKYLPVFMPPLNLPQL